jgi:hypothetical protein
VQVTDGLATVGLIVTQLEVVGSPALGVQKVEEMAVVQEVEEKATVQVVEEKVAVQAVQAKVAVQAVEEKAAVQGMEGTARVEEEMARDEIVAMQDLEC